MMSQSTTKKVQKITQRIQSIGPTNWLSILVDAHYAKFAKDLEQTQKHINSLMVQRNIVATDKLVAAETDAHQRTMLITKGSAKARPNLHNMKWNASLLSSLRTVQTSLIELYNG